MVQHGTVVNGVIVPDGPPPPEGTRVMFEAQGSFEYPHPLAPYDWEKELALLRESIAAMDAGEKGKPAEQVFAELDQELDRNAIGEG
ncbi:MAG: hypothetical protein C0467_23015 [Planctomycetaceae bacterium]|nr:hypothetical protein [Planctomycetaceae bacterium]